MSLATETAEDVNFRTRAKRVSLSRQQIRDAIKFIEKHTTKIEGTDLYEYAFGWSDAIIAEHIGGERLAAHVGRLRIELGYRFNTKKDPSKQGDLFAVEELRSEVKDLRLKLSHATGIIEAYGARIAALENGVTDQSGVMARLNELGRKVEVISKECNAASETLRRLVGVKAPSPRY